MIKIKTMEQNDKLVELLEEARVREVHLAQTFCDSIIVTEIRADGSSCASMCVDVMGGISYVMGGIS